jgi:hypothetical protein
VRLAEVVTLLILLIIFIQDWVSRAVNWILFPLLGALLMGMSWARHVDVAMACQAMAFNSLYLLVQLLFITAWFSIKEKRLINITQRLLGWGDILFFIGIAFYLSSLNFLFFQIASLVIVLTVWTAALTLLKKTSIHIPLAGFQALLFAFFLMADWWCFHFDATSDNWLLRFYMN